MSQYFQVIMTAATSFPFIAFLLTFPVLLINYHRYGSISKWSIFMTYTFIFYLMCAYFLIILPLPPLSYVEHLTTPRYNLRPFVFILEFIRDNPFSLFHPHTWIPAIEAPTVIQPLFNIFLTVPFGFYLRNYFHRGIKQTLLLSFCLSLFFELTQLSGLYGIYPRPYRLFDVDDLMLNTLGGVVGYLVAKPLVKWLPSKERILQTASVRSQTVSIFRRAVGFGCDIITLFMTMLLINLFPVFSKATSEIAIVLAIIVPQIIWQKSLGMALVRIKVTNAIGNRPQWWQIVVRNLLAYGVTGGLIMIELQLMDSDIAISATHLSWIHILIIGLTIPILLIIIDFIMEMFSKTHRLYFERFSGTDTRNTYEN